VPLLDFIAAIENALGCRAQLDLQPMQPGDVPITHADVTRLRALTGPRGRSTAVAEGVRRFVQWYREFYESDLRQAQPS
jgi:UDP-glucuronate 4-epimerase